MDARANRVDAGEEEGQGEGGMPDSDAHDAATIIDPDDDSTEKQQVDYDTVHHTHEHVAVTAIPASHRGHLANELHGSPHGASPHGHSDAADHDSDETLANTSHSHARQPLASADGAYDYPSSVDRTRVAYADQEALDAALFARLMASGGLDTAEVPPPPVLNAAHSDDSEGADDDTWSSRRELAEKQTHKLRAAEEEEEEGRRRKADEEAQWLLEAAIAGWSTALLVCAAACPPLVRRGGRGA
jgi:hypothetical protein